MIDGNVVITTQLTSKRLKFNLVAGKVIFFIGLIMIALYMSKEPEDLTSEESHGVAWGCVVTLYGIIHYWVTRLRIWWNHK